MKKQFKKYGIVDYESMYNKLVEAVRTVLEGNPDLCNIDKGLDRLSKLLPEKEKDCENERIRKTLIRIVKGAWGKYGVKYIGDESEEKLLAYLEKQKDQKPAEWSDSVAKEMFIKALERAVEQTKKGYELTDCDKHSWWEDFKAYSGINSAEWSEEDEKNRRPLRDGEIKVGDIITFFRNGNKGILLVSSFDSGIYPRCKWGISDIDGDAYGDWAPGSETYYAATEKEKQQLYNTMPRRVKDWFESLHP